MFSLDALILHQSTLTKQRNLSPAIKFPRLERVDDLLRTIRMRVVVRMEKGVGVVVPVVAMVMGVGSGFGCGCGCGRGRSSMDVCMSVGAGAVSMCYPGVL